MSASPPVHHRLSGASAAVLGFAALGVINAGRIALLSMPSGGPAIRVLHHLHDAGHWVAIAVIAALLASTAGPLRLPRLVHQAAALVPLAALLGVIVLRDDFEGLAAKTVSERWADAAQTTFAIAGGLSLAAAYAAGRASARPSLRPVAVVVGAAVAILHEAVLDHAYPGVHFFIAIDAVVLAAAAAAGLRLPGVLQHRLRVHRWAAVSLLLVAGIAGATSLAVRPRSTVLTELYRLDSSIVAPQLAKHYGSTVRGEIVIPPTMHQWFDDKRFKRKVKPSKPPLLPKDAIVLLVTVDSFRADLFWTEANRKTLPNLFALRDTSVYFRKARATGSGTRISLGGLFTGRYFSQLHWTKPQGGQVRLDGEESARFPKRLKDAGVRTVTLVSEFKALTGKVGIIRGFEEMEVVPAPEGQEFALSEGMVNRAIEVLKGHEHGPLFLFMHLMDAHLPYDAATKRGKKKTRWLAEVKLIDEAIGRLLHFIDEQQLASRTALIVSADHGEEFGEHDSWTHNNTLYEELVRVPLFIRVPGTKPHVVERWVQLTDLGPTILDLMHVRGTGWYMGDSLVPYLRGQDPPYTRPLVAERRYGYSVLLPGDIKVIVDWQKGTEEIYDLGADPRELNNLRDEPGPEPKERLLLAGEVIDWLRLTSPGANGNQHTPRSDFDRNEGLPPKKEKAPTANLSK